MHTANLLMRVEKGMRVLDRDRHEIGTVERVQIGDDDPSTPEVEAADPGVLRQRRESILGALADAFRTDGLPDEVQERLLLQGFVRIDSKGLFASDRYVTPDQIMAVDDDAVTLSVGKDELVKRH